MLQDKSKSYAEMIAPYKLQSMAFLLLIFTPVLLLSQTQSNDMLSYLQTLENSVQSEIEIKSKETFDHINKKRIQLTPGRLICGSVIYNHSLSWKNYEIKFVVSDTDANIQPLWALNSSFSRHSIYRFLSD
ncbi:hypothetical protein [Marinicella sp. W31]|uniref:hypothetical protein n=1 Tax=Marinicella sp. W31 TaxID=3023713 RepID=UPI0037570676